MYQQQSSSSYAEIGFSKTCFGLKPRHKSTVCVLNEADAAVRVQDETALLWVDISKETIFLTERWGSDTVCHKLPAKISVKKEAPSKANHEVPVTSLAFSERSSAEHYGKLALNLLPEWLSIRRSTAAKSLLVLTDHWIVTEAEQALKLQHPAGHLQVLLRLDVGQACIQAVLIEESGSCKTYQVSCLGDVTKLLRKHSKPQERLEKVVHSVLQELKPSASSVGRLLARLEAAAMRHKGVPSIAQWCRGGVMAALVDTAAALGRTSGRNERSKGGHRHSTPGCSDQSIQQERRSASMPGAAPVQAACDSTADLATLQALAECCCVMMQYGTPVGEQAELLAACVSRALMGSFAEAVCALQLLHMVLRHLGPLSKSPACVQLLKACCHPQLLQQLEHCFSRAVAPQQQQQLKSTDEQHLLLSHQLEGLSPDGASEPTTPIGGQHGLQEQASGVSAELGSLSDLPTTTPRSPAGFFLRRRSLVPKLHLPVPVTPAPNSCSRLSVQSTAQAVHNNTSTSFSSTDKGAGWEQKVAAPSYLRALQQLGRSCGQSVMAADLAAFVTHKQLLGGVVALEATLQHSRHASIGTQQDVSSCHMPANGQIGFDQLSELPVQARLHVMLLEILSLMADMPGSELVLPKPWEHLLMSPLLSFKSTWLHCGGGVSGVGAGRERTLLERAYSRVRALTLQLVQHSSRLRHMCLSAGSSTAANAGLSTSSVARLHQSVLEQFKARLAVCSMEGPAVTAGTHSDCAELLLLLRDYLHMSQQPQLADTACFMLGGVLAQQEHMLRATRMEHWPLEAVVHMDALVQLYTQVLGQVSFPAAAAWLLAVLGVQASEERSGCGAAAAISSSPHPSTPVPADTLQLLLDYLTHLAALAAAADGHSTAAQSADATAATPVAACPTSTQNVPSSRVNSKRAADGAAGCSTNSLHGLLLPSVSAVQQVHTTCGSADAFVMQLRANCWTLLNRLLLLAHRHPTSRPHEVFGSPLYPKVSSTSYRDGLQRPLERQGDVTPGSQRTLVQASTPKGILQSSLNACSAAAAAQQPSEEPAVPHAQNMRPSLPLLSTPNSCSTSSTPSAHRGSNDGVSLSSANRTPSGLLAAQCRPSGFPSGCCSIWQVLIELLMVNSSMGQATALQHMAETNGNRLLLPLQRAATAFLSTALGTPDSYAFTKPQLAEFYVHHHFLHFTQNYHKLPTSPASAALCKSHLKVLLALCRHTGGAHQVRRRFLQLKVLEFVVREASLEYMYLHNQLAASPSSSSCSTPLSTSRTAASYRTSAQDTTGPAGGAAAAAGTPTGTAAYELANGGSAGLGPSWELSSANGRGASSSRLWVSSPGCHLSARSAQHTQRSGSSRGLRSGAEGAARREQQASGMGSVLAASESLQSYAVEGLCNDMGELLLTGSSGLLTGTGSLPAGWSGADAGPSSSSRAAAAGSQPGRQPSIKLGSKVKAAVEALESAAAAVGQQPLLQPQPPASACPPAAAAGRRQPGQQRLVGVGEPGQAACSPQVPKLKLPTSCPAADVNPASGSRQSPNGGIVVWQQLEPPLEEAAADDGGSGASPRADIAGYEVPASMRSQRRIKQPKLTGDASLDNIIIDSWERRTGLEYQFDDFGADVDAAGSSLGSSSSSQGKACQESLPSSPQRADATVQSAAGIKSALRPQTPGLASLVALGSSAGHDQIWALPHFDLGPVPGSSRWISSSDTVEDAAPVSVTQILREGHKHSTGRDVSNSTPADRSNGAAAAAASIGPGKVQIPRLCMGGLQSEQMPLGDSSRAMSTPHSPCSTGASSCRECEDVAASPGSYKPGFDLEEDFERLMAAGDWDDSDSDAGSEPSTQPGAYADACSPPSPHPGAYAAAQAPQNRLQNGSQLLLRAPHPPCEPCRQQQQEPASLEHGCSSPDVQAAADVHSSKGKAQKRGKKQAVVAGSRAPVVAELSAHALADVSGSSSDGSQCAGNSSDSEVDSDSCSDVPGPWPVGPSPTHTPAIVIPRLNLPQLQQPSWHLPMADTALLTGESSEAALSSSYRTSITSASRGTPLTVVPLTTGRLTGGAADSSRGRSTNTAGPGPNSSQRSGRFGSSARGQTRLSHLLEPCADAGQAEGAPCTPSTTAAVGPSSGPYAAHRAKCAVYMDLELHALCMELALHLLVTPNGQLDPVQLPHEPTDVSLQRKVMLLLEHLSHPANFGMACALAQRACSILRQQQQDPGAMLSSSGQPAASEQPSSRAGALDSMVLGSAHSGGSSAASQQDLQEALRAVWHDAAYQLVRAGRTASGSAGSEGGSGLASTASLAADAAAGLAVSSLRLLKLLCAPVLDTRRLDVGGMINKGAFSEIMAGMYYSPDGSAPIAVALKVMDCSQDDACSFERVYNEVVSLEVLHGKPHVVPLLEYGVTSNISGTRQWVLVFPRYASSMREWRTKWAGKGLNTQDLSVYLSLFLQVARAVAVLHSSNVVHFDIKGDNVLLQHGFNPASLDQPSSSSRPSADIVLADFGDALMLENAHASSQRHRGTELFSSPEMLLLHAGRQHAHHAQHDRRKHRGVHAAHDVWSLGCTLYELLTGSVLFEDEGVGRITSYSSSQSSGGGAHSLRPDARGWGVLNAREKAALQHHTGCIELVESMLVGEPNWRPTAEQVVHKTQRLLASLHL